MKRKYNNADCSDSPILNNLSVGLLDTIGNKRIPAKKKSGIRSEAPAKRQRDGLIDPLKAAYERKRAAKALTKAAMYKMFGLQSHINDDYRQAYMCNEYLYQMGDKITSNYCRKKCCTVCNRIRSAQNLNKYGERILNLEHLYLVTLTAPNVGKGELEAEVKRMYDSLAKIKRNINKNYKENKIHGFRTFECTYNWKTGFNPHFHFIVKGESTAMLLKKLWLNQFPQASDDGQDVRPVEPTKENLLEVFKYIAKPVTRGYYSATAYDEIMIVAKAHRVTEPLGSIRGKEEVTDDINLDELQAQEITFKGYRFSVWRYIHELYDYVSPTGELLLGTELETKTKKAINVIEKSTTVTNSKRKTANEIMRENRTTQEVIF